MAAVMSEEQISRGWEQAKSFAGERPFGTYTVEVKVMRGMKYYLLTDGCGNFWYTSEGTIRVENELNRNRKNSRQKISL